MVNNNDNNIKLDLIYKFISTHPLPKKNFQKTGDYTPHPIPKICSEIENRGLDPYPTELSYPHQTPPHVHPQKISKIKNWRLYPCPTKPPYYTPAHKKNSNRKLDITPYPIEPFYAPHP